MLKGIDVSKWQGDLNFDDVKLKFDFIIFKTSEGNGYTDPKFSRNQSEARRVGILHGYYHFARPDLGNSATAEADWFLKTLGQLQDGEMLVLDYEPSWGGDAVSWCYDFLNRVFTQTQCRPLIYLNQSQVKNYNWTKVINENFGLWLAVYDYNPDTPPPVTPWPTVAIKQYSNKLPYGTLAVDGDVFYGDTNAFRAYGYKVINSEPNMSDDEIRALDAIKNFKQINTDPIFGNLEGAANAAVGAFRDVPNLNKKIEEQKVELEKLHGEVAKLTADLALASNSATDWQTKYEAANIDNQKLQKDLEFYQPYKARYEAALQKTIDKYTGWQLIRMGVTKLTTKK